MAPFYVVFVAIIATAQATIFPSQYEFEYDYEAKVQTLVQKPLPYTSEYSINAKVLITKVDNDIFVKFKDVTHNIYAGKLDTATSKSKGLGLNSKTETIEKPFIIQHDFNGKVTDVLTEKDDKLWSVNFKKALASLLQIDSKQVDSKKTSPYVFTSEEQTVLGNCQIHYTVEPRNNKNQFITKQFTTDSCNDFKVNMIYNTDPIKCNVRDIQPFTYTSERYYNVENDGNYLKLQHIEGFNTIIFNPVNDDSNPHTVMINQTLHERSSRKLDNTVKTNLKEVQHNKIKTIFNKNSTDQHFYDFTGERHVINKDTVISRVRNSLRNIYNYMNKNHVRLVDTSAEQKGNVNFLIHHLRTMNLEQLTNCFNGLMDLRDTSGKHMEHIFLHVLSQTGTRASIDLIFKVIKERKLDDKVAIKILQEIPNRLRNVDKNLMKNFIESILESHDVDMNIKNTGLLVFGSLISKLERNYPNNDSELKGYIDHLMDTLMKTDDYKTKVLYLSTLKNIENNNAIFGFLERIVKNKTESMHGITPHLRVLAMWGLEQRSHNESVYIDNVFWPILVNKKENIQVRETALQILVRHVDMNGHVKLYNYMKSLINTDLYGSYYANLKNLIKSGVNCNNVHAHNAKIILSFVKQPTVQHYSNLHDLVDILDPNLGLFSVNTFTEFGDLIKYKFKHIFLQWSPQIGNMKFLQQGIYVYIEMKESLKNTLMNSVSSHEDLKKVLKNVHPNDLILEMIHLKYGRVVSVSHYNGNNLEDMLQTVFGNVNSNVNNYEIDQFADQDTVIPTDLGVPAVLFVHTPVVRKTKFVNQVPYHKGHMIGMKIKFNSMLWHHHRYGIAVYNSISDAWHGNRKTVVTDIGIPVNIVLGINVKEMKIEVKLIHDQNENIINGGFQTYIANQIFTFTENENVDDLKKMCSRCQPVTNVVKGEDYQKKNVIEKSDNAVGGLNYEYAIFDCERKMTPVRKNILRNIFMNNNYDKDKITITNMLGVARNWNLYDMIYPEPELCGLGLQMKSNGVSVDSDSKENDEDVFEYRKNYKRDSEETKESKFNSNEFNEDETSNVKPVNKKIDVETTYNVVKDNQNVGKWHFKVSTNVINSEKCEINLMLTTDNERIDYKICMRGKYDVQNVDNNGQWEVFIENKHSDKCNYDKRVLQIFMTGKRSEELSNNLNDDVYKKCLRENGDDRAMCSQLSIIRYEYDVKIDKLTQQSDKILKDLKDMLYNLYSDYHVKTFRTDTEHINEDMKLIIDVQKKSQDVDISIITPKKGYSYKRIPLSDLELYGVVHIQNHQLQNHQLQNNQLQNHQVQKQNHQHIENEDNDKCIVEEDYIMNIHNEKVQHKIGNEWERLAGDCNGELCKWDISVKRSNQENMKMIRVKHDDDVLMVNPQSGYQFTYNGKNLRHMDTGYYNGPWFTYKIIHQENLMVLNLEHLNVHIDVNDNVLKVILPKSESFKGICYEVSNNMHH